MRIAGALFFLAVAMARLPSCGNKGGETSTAYLLPPEIEEVPYGTQYGLRAFEISGKNHEGETVQLSDLHGSLVLLDFWASWCPPCRKENPELVKLYREYKDKEFANGKGLKIFSVSLDRDEASWIQAIEKDGLTWPWQICDLAGARSTVARNYGINAIPTSFLLDRNGVIIGTNLRGSQLESTLEELIKE